MGRWLRQRTLIITGELALTMVMVMLPGVVPEAWAGWTSKTSMPTARTWLSVAEVNGTLYAVGGNTMGGTDVTGPSLAL